MISWWPVDFCDLWVLKANNSMTKMTKRCWITIWSVVYWRIVTLKSAPTIEESVTVGTINIHLDYRTGGLTKLKPGLFSDLFKQSVICVFYSLNLMTSNSAQDWCFCAFGKLGSWSPDFGFARSCAVCNSLLISSVVGTSSGSETWVLFTIHDNVAT